MTWETSPFYVWLTNLKSNVFLSLSTSYSLILCGIFQKERAGIIIRKEYFIANYFWWLFLTDKFFALWFLSLVIDLETQTSIQVTENLSRKIMPCCLTLFELLILQQTIVLIVLKLIFFSHATVCCYFLHHYCSDRKRKRFFCILLFFFFSWSDRNGRKLLRWQKGTWQWWWEVYVSLTSFLSWLTTLPPSRVVSHVYDV